MSSPGQLRAEDLDRRRPEPIHRQLAELIRDRIDSGAWPVHFRLLPEPDLATELGISRGTLRKAIGQLAGEGRLSQVPGRGTFVTARQFEPPIAARLSTLSEDFLEQGVQLTSTVLEQRVVAASDKVAALLEIPLGAAVFHLHRTATGPDGIVAVLSNCVRLDLCPGVERVDFTTTRLFGYLENDAGLEISHGRRTFHATAAPLAISGELGVEPMTPILYLEQITYLAQGGPVEYSDVWIHPERMRISAILPRR